MSNCLEWYKDRMETISWVNVTETETHSAETLVLRRGKTITASTVNDAKLFMLDLGTPLYNGALITRLKDSKRYMVIARQYSTDMLHIQGRRINGIIRISSIDDVIENHRKTGVKETVTAEDVPVYWQNVSAYMQIYDAGLLPQCRRKMLVRKNIPIQMYQRVTFTNSDSVYDFGNSDVYKQDVYTVENIDGAKYEGLNEVQLGDDTRGQKGVAK